MVDLYELAFARAMGGGGTPAPEPTLITKNITANGTYTAASDNADGYSKVNVNVETVPDYSITPFSNASANGIYALGAAYDWTTAFEAQICVLTMDDPSSWQYDKSIGLLGPWGALKINTPIIEFNKKINRDPQYELKFLPPNSQYTGTEYDMVSYKSSTSPFTAGSPSWIRVSYDGGGIGVGKVKMLLSNDKQTFTTLGETTITYSMTTPSSPLGFGGIGGGTSSAKNAIPYMTLIFNECYVKLNGEYVWGRA